MLFPRIGKPVRNNLLLIVIFILAYFAILNYFSYFEVQLVQDFIMKTEVLFYILTIIALLSVLILSGQKIYQNLKSIKKDVWIYALVIFIFALLIREVIPPKTTRLFFDEDIYLDMAKQIATHGSSCLCDYGTKYECFKCELMKWPVAHPFLISIPFFIFGSSNLISSHFMVFLSSLSTVFIFFSSYILFKDKRIAIFSALILALLPVHILWSTTSSADVTFSFFTSVVLFLSILSAQSTDIRIHLISLLVLALSVQTKSEGVILILLYFLTQILLNKKYTKMLEKKSYALVLIASFLLMSIYFLHIFYTSRTDTWGSTGEKFAISYLYPNVLSNLSYWFEAGVVTDPSAYVAKQLYHPIIFTLLACVGLVALFKKDSRKFIVLFSWLGILFLLYASFYAGGVYFGVDVRYVLPQYIPFSVICGFGIFSIFNYLRKKIDKNITFIFIIFVLLVYFSLYIPKMHIPAEDISESYGARLYTKSAIDFASDYPDDCYFISHVSSLYSWLGKGQMQIWYIYQPEFDSIVRNSGCVIFDEGYWCAINVQESKSCVEFSNKYNLILLNRVNDSVENKVYSFYKVVLK